MRTKLKGLKDRRAGLFELLDVVREQIKEAEESILLADEEREYILYKIIEIDAKIAKEKS